ncbi:hypothetical protein D5S18_18915 [Nocardia panacis]|uniref:Uncharacterized protein n=1 Tax=Nocardia panacis TaxID=2340916 RepID=A0A3A4K755_9NOCA|nr:hypothetical protein [Nocardia panacis]RJO73322.1 hypothetical protein D5S18_18915 [Nocardia panacis]
MTVFGSGTVCYLAHRPAFRAPHDFQILLEVALDERGTRALADDRAFGRDAHTFLPELFTLSELDPRAARPRTRFRGTLMRGGLPIACEVEARVRTVVYFAALDAPPDPVATHLCFGQAGRLYLAHRIARRPSFDQIVTARPVPGTATDLTGEPLTDPPALEFARAESIIVGQRSFAGNRLRAGEIAVAAFPSDGFLVELAVDRQIRLAAIDSI